MNIIDIIEKENLKDDAPKFNVGDTVRVWVKIKEGDKVQGTVTRLKHFGAFIEVLPGVEALLPHNEVVDFQNETGNIVKVGDKIDTYVVKFNPADKRISLSIHEQGSEPTPEQE